MKNKTITYPAIFKKESPEGYYIEFPDIKEAYSGSTSDDMKFAMEMAQKALKMVAKVYMENDMRLPKPTSLNEIRVNQGSIVKQICITIEED
ncbi:type II toxin-antitoxin system HicB family antitoxin [Enterococcus sp. DIV0876]|uniref:type II toxin-antitoxin system HicB family antitoxin n=1 Tax=Enterococcus sp. DIV0876 TaxID=2774633 RepID=UPI003D2FC87E